MAALLHPGHCTMSSLAISFWSKNVMFFQHYDVITWGFPAKIGETPSKSRFRLISSRNVHADNQTQCNDTCFVQNLRLKPVPTPFPIPSPPLSLPHPHTPHPYPQQYVCRSLLWRVSNTPLVPLPLPPTPWVCPTHKHTNNFCID